MNDDAPGASIYTEPILSEDEEQDAWSEEWARHDREFADYREMLAAAAEKRERDAISTSR